MKGYWDREEYPKFKLHIHTCIEFFYSLTYLNSETRLEMPHFLFFSVASTLRSFSGLDVVISSPPTPLMGVKLRLRSIPVSSFRDAEHCGHIEMRMLFVITCYRSSDIQFNLVVEMKSLCKFRIYSHETEEVQDLETIIQMQFFSLLIMKIYISCCSNFLLIAFTFSF